MLNSKTKDVKQKNEGDFNLLSEKSPFTVQEAFKTLRTNVMFSLPGTECKCIGITSADRGDGKSSVALNLAISFAQLKKKVLIVDCDMRLPTIASKLGISQSPGLSNLLAGQTESQEKLIVKAPSKNFDVLPAGDIPPDPTVLLESKQMDKLVRLLKDHYDYVIFDFPPARVVTDAVILSRLIDGYFLVVRHNYSEYNGINDVLRTMKFAGAKVLGFVYNGKSNSSGYSSGKKYYYYSNHDYKKD